MPSAATKRWREHPWAADWIATRQSERALSQHRGPGPASSCSARKILSKPADCSGGVWPQARQGQPSQASRAPWIGASEAKSKDNPSIARTGGNQKWSCCMPAGARFVGEPRFDCFGRPQSNNPVRLASNRRGVRCSAGPVGSYLVEALPQPSRCELLAAVAVLRPGRRRRLGHQRQSVSAPHRASPLSRSTEPAGAFDGGA
jgi:hypothetical protein